MMTRENSMLIRSCMTMIFALVYFMTFAAACDCGGDDDDSGDDAVADDTADDDATGDDTSGDDTMDDTGDDIGDDSIDDDSADDDTIVDDTADDDSIDDDSGDDDTGPHECVTYGTPEVVGSLGATDLTEASGLAVSRRNPGVLWAHNDSGDGPYLYAMAMDGAYLGRLELSGATATDWEDIAAGPCGDEECLYVGDTGDNGASRAEVRLYRVAEPDVDPVVPFNEMTTADWEVFPFTYPDGPRDCESLAVHPDGRVYVFSKYPYGISEMYVFPSLTPDAPVIVTHLGDLDSGGAVAATTAADIHAGGKRLLLRTYLTAVEWRLPEGEDFNDLPVAGERIEVPAGLELQGEAIAYAPEDGSYLQTAEGRGAIIYRVPCGDVRPGE
jgi:hypothetical protein